MDNVWEDNAFTAAVQMNLALLPDVEQHERQNLSQPKLASVESSCVFSRQFCAFWAFLEAMRSEPEPP